MLALKVMYGMQCYTFTMMIYFISSSNLVLDIHSRTIGETCKWIDACSWPERQRPETDLISYPHLGIYTLKKKFVRKVIIMGTMLEFGSSFTFKIALCDASSAAVQTREEKRLPRRGEHPYVDNSFFILFAP